ncbi:MAG: hypothetical protein WC095_01565 [Candidatus Paceibacterota bacterium]
MFSNLLNGSFVSTDIIALLVLFIIFFSYSLYFGKNRIISLILAFYPALYLFSSFPFRDKLIFLQGDTMILINNIVLFLLFLVPLDIIIGRYISSIGYGGMKYLKITGYSLGLVVLVLIFSYSVVSLDSLYNFGSSVDNIFSNDYRFWLTLFPLAILLAL